MPAGTLLLARTPGGEPEIFASIQGEGASAGTPSTFIRLAVCNLQCAWCDTAYTWDWKRYRREEAVVPVEPGVILAYTAGLPPRNVVVTGGEPLLQRHSLVPLLTRLHELGYRLEVETNGTIAPGELSAVVDQWNVSPKLASAGNRGLRTIRPAALEAFAALPGTWFKFVISAPEDVDEAHTIASAAGMAPGRVILMPEGRTPGELSARSEWLAATCAERGFRFSTRLHVLIWGDRRGV